VDVIYKTPRLAGKLLESHCFQHTADDEVVRFGWLQ
jgi:hypothetical protein